MSRQPSNRNEESSGDERDAAIMSQQTAASPAPSAGNFVSREEFIQLQRALVNALRKVPPHIGSPEAPCFEGRNATEFVERFESLRRDYVLGEGRVLIDRFLEYCAFTYRPTIRAFEGYRLEDYDLLKKEFLRQWAQYDSHRIIGTRTYLERLTRDRLTLEDDLEEYLRQFTVSSEMIPRQDLEMNSRTRLLLRGLPEKFSERIHRQKGLHPDDESTYRDFDGIYAAVKDMVRGHRGYQLSKNSATDSRMDMLHHELSAHAPTFSPSLSASKKSDSAMEDLTTKFEQMLINAVQRASNHTTVVPVNPARGTTGYTAPAATSTDIDAYALQQGDVAPELTGKCWNCGTEGHIGRDCPAVAFLVQNRYAYRNDQNRWFIGVPLAPGQPPIPLRYKWDRKTPKLFYMIPAIEAELRRTIHFPEHLGIEQKRLTWQGSRDMTGVASFIKRTDQIPSGSLSYAQPSSSQQPPVSVSYLQSDRQLVVRQKPESSVVDTYASTATRSSDRPDVSRPNQEAHRVLKNKIAAQRTAAQTRQLKAHFQPSVEDDDDEAVPHSSQSGRSLTQGRVIDEVEDNLPPDDETMIEAEPVPVNAPHKQRKEPKTRRMDNYLREHDDEADKAELFFLDKILQGKIEMTVGDMVKYNQPASNALYKRVPNNSEFIDELRDYRRRTSRKNHSYAVDANIAQVPANPNASNEDNVNVLYAMSVVDKAAPRPASELYEHPDGVDLSAVNNDYVTVPSAWVEAQFGPRRIPMMALIDEGAEACIISLKMVKKHNLPMIQKHQIAMNSASGRSLFAGICPDLRVDCFGVVFNQHFMVSPNDDSPILLGRPWTRKVRMVGRNCDDGSWEGTIAAADGKTVIFTGCNGNEGCRTIEDIASGKGKGGAVTSTATVATYAIQRAEPIAFRNKEGLRTNAPIKENFENHCMRLCDERAEREGPIHSFHPNGGKWAKSSFTTNCGDADAYQASAIPSDSQKFDENGLWDPGVPWASAEIVIQDGSPEVSDEVIAYASWINSIIGSRRRQSGIGAYTLYKKKADKVKPVEADVSMTDGSSPGGSIHWRADCLRREALLPPGTGPFDGTYLIKKFSDIERGSRLTQEALRQLSFGIELRPKELMLVHEMLFNREKVLAFDFTHLGRVRPEVAPPQLIRTIEHKPWQHPGFRLHPSLRTTVEEMLRARLAAGTLEPCHGAYRNPYFLVAKKETKKYRLINAAQEFNRVTIRDANLPPDTDSFSEDFAGCVVASLVDIFSGYDQVPLDESCRDLTGFDSPLGLLRQTTLPQGATNSVAQFVRIITQVLMHHISHAARPFLDDVGIKGPKTTYDDEEIEEGLRRFVVEHVTAVDGVLADLERAGITVAFSKLQLLCKKIKIVGYVTDAEGRHPDAVRVLKIVEWPTPSNQKEVRIFVGIVVYYRVWVDHFAIVAKPLFFLLRKTVQFVWNAEQQAAKDAITKALVEAPALAALDYSDDAGVIYVAIDASGDGHGEVIMQADKHNPKLRHPVRYESGLWSEAEQRYDAGKLECLAVLKGLKKFKSWLFGAFFVLEIDANTLVHQLNKPASDLPNATITRWIAWIRLFTFTVQHVPGKKHGAPDSLSRKPPTARDIEERDAEEDDEKMIDRVFFDTFCVNNITVLDDTDPASTKKCLDGIYTPESYAIAYILTQLNRPPQMSTSEYKRYLRKSRKFFVKDRTLFRQAAVNAPLQRVLDDPQARQDALIAMHEDNGHRGPDGTFDLLRRRYWWEGMYSMCALHCKSCPECSFRNGHRRPGELTITQNHVVGERWYADALHIDGTGCLFIAREALSRWPEARVYSGTAKSLSAQQIARFLWEDIFCRWGTPFEIVLDGAQQHKGEVARLLSTYGVKRVRISPYHPQSNAVVEVGHKPILSALSKLSKGGIGSWKKHVPSVLWAERTTTVSTTGQTPAYLMVGREAVLPIELEHLTYGVLDWGSVRDRGTLLEHRARALEDMTTAYEEVSIRQNRMREATKDYFDRRQAVDTAVLKTGSLVLVHKGELLTDFSHKLAFRWRGPFRIHAVLDTGNAYILEELDGTALTGTFNRENLKSVPPFRPPVPEVLSPEPSPLLSRPVAMVDLREALRMPQEAREEFVRYD